MRSCAEFEETVKRPEESAFFVLKATGVQKVCREEYENGLRDLRLDWLGRLNHQLKGAA
jgi:hypothetical protein